MSERRRALRSAAALAFVSLAVLAGAAFARPAFADEGWEIVRFHADIAIQSDGSLHIEETIDVDHLHTRDDRDHDLTSLHLTFTCTVTGSPGASRSLSEDRTAGPARTGSQGGGSVRSSSSGVFSALSASQVHVLRPHPSTPVRRS